MMNLDARVRGVIAGLHESLRTHRSVFLGIGLSLFVLGLWLSFSSIRRGQYQPVIGLLVLNALLLTPLALVLNAWGLRLSARAVGSRIALRNAVAVSSGSTIAEVMPIPAGLIARTAAIVAGGATALSAGKVLTAGALLWVGMCSAVGAMALLDTAPTAGVSLLLLGLVLGVLGSVWIHSLSSGSMLLMLWAHRVLSLAVVVARVLLAYRGLGGVLSPLEAGLITCAYVIGSLSTILPAGLGIGEGLSALAAISIGVNPAMAFAATALNRLFLLLVSGAVAIPALGWRISSGKG